MGFRINRRRSERGAVTVLFAALVVVLFAIAALGVDIAKQVNQKHLLKNQLDSASTAAAAKLGAQNGSIADAVAAAQAYFANSGQGELNTSKIDFWCVVAQKAGSSLDPRVSEAQIPTAAQAGGVCNPDAVPGEDGKWFKSNYQNRSRASDGPQFSMACDDTLCAVPCALNAQESNGWDPGDSGYNNRPIKCNTIRVGAEQDVPFSFGGAVGIDEGSTGSQISVACAGSCGTVAPNPMDVVVVADRTLSMQNPEICTYTGASPCTDYRTSLANGITSMLQVMTPEQQFVALGALGPSERTRSNAESNTCDKSQKGLVYPSDEVSTSSKGSWVPISFKNDYLGSANASGDRTLNTSSKLVQAIDCLDRVDAGSPASSRTSESRLATTRTALASPLKAAARFLLGTTSDGNNIALLGGGNRSGTVKKVIIFETDGEPFENTTTTAAGNVSLGNNGDIFSNYQDSTDIGHTSTTGPSLGNAQDGTPRTVSPAPPSPYNQSSTYPSGYSYGGNNYDYDYKYRLNTTTKWHTWAGSGGQKACQNFAAIANAAKTAGILVITIGYNLDSSTMCSASNSVSTSGMPSPTATATGTPWISDISPSACRGTGNGSQQSPWVPKTSCARDMDITYTVPQDSKAYNTTKVSGNDQAVTNVLAAASGGPDVPTGASTGCTGAAQIAAENGDDDLFFCAASGQDLAPLFVTALSKVTSGVKLMNLPH